jgi:hypothetical protein
LFKQNNKQNTENENEDINKGKDKNIKIPELFEFLEIANKKLIEAKLNPDAYAYSIKQKYEQWVADGWKDGNGTPIKTWKTKIANTIPFLKPLNGTPKQEQLPADWKEQIKPRN